MTEVASTSISNESRTSRNRFRRNKDRPAVSRPKPKYKNARDGEIGQMVKLYKPEKINDELFKIQMKPSDPDFPFDIPFLRFDLTIPKAYPKECPLVHVTNTDIPVGYAANVDLGFKNEISQPKLGKVRLLDMMLDLDKHLEEFLSREKQETFKIIRKKRREGGVGRSGGGKGTAEGQKGGSDGRGNASEGQGTASERNRDHSRNTSKGADTSKGAANGISHGKSAFSYRNQVFIPDSVVKDRARQILLLEKRLGENLKKQSSSNKGDLYSIFISSRDNKVVIPELSVTFKANLFIPKDYPLTGCALNLPIGDNAARNIEDNFNNYALKGRNTWTLLSLVNLLSCKLDQLMLPVAEYQVYEQQMDGNAIRMIEKQPLKEKDLNKKDTGRERSSEGVNKREERVESHEMTSVEAKPEKDQCTKDQLSDSDQPDEDQADVDELGQLDSDENSSTSHDPPSTTNSSTPDGVVRRGTELSFALDEFTNIAYMECHSLNVQIECQRCKTVNDAVGIMSAAYGKTSKPTYVECRKCNLELAVAFRKDIMHSGSKIVGYLDFSECKVVDYLPSLFNFTCESCSNTMEKPIKVDLGRKVSQRCHECHKTMTIKINTFEFTKMEVKSMKLARKSDRKPVKLQLQLGSPFVNNGACKHYKKSMRWFRFSCCSKVFACDKCHDSELDHPCENANRMICGRCSKEQAISMECILCHLSFDTSHHSAFWEGGRGTRDKTKMSRKDPRKYKRSQQDKVKEKERRDKDQKKRAKGHQKQDREQGTG